MRIERSVVTISWIPSESVTGMSKAAFGAGPGHYDDPPPEVIDDLDAMRDADAFRFANRLEAWVDVEDGAIVGHGYSGGIVMGATTLTVGGRQATFEAVSLPDIQAEPVVQGDSVTFVQTVGGRTGVPAPRHVNHPPFVQFDAPIVWTTLSLTIHADGTTTHELLGASAFPRHWRYDTEGKLDGKAGLADFKEWYRHSFGKHTPWGDTDSEVFVTEVETALERDLATRIMRGGKKPAIRKVKEGDVLTEQGTEGDELFLLLNGVLTVEVDGEALADLGPGAILGERAVLEGGVRTSTLRARTKAKVAVAKADEIDRDALTAVSTGHRREDG
jgi:hypothetical protein